MTNIRAGLKVIRLLLGSSMLFVDIRYFTRLDDESTKLVRRNVFAPPADLDFPSAGHDGTANRSVVADLPFETLLQFPAGWATFENECYLNQNAVLEPELFNPDLANINWEFDNVFVDDRAIF
ncbi:hypothetical protein IFR04_013470 [Cadophora malorum]|uniref:Uncharacterized protein n=1 Tax=Cadophora malorum TaxID=108018 RepID=A0A8H7T5K9_9HELO|nr:hypothetical protein IFR04_013470 [Cadophora malorum]